MRGLLDTSVFVAREQRRSRGALPDEAAISVMTVAELHTGALVAREAGIRAQRMRTLAEVERAFDPLLIDPPVARRFAEIIAVARRRGRKPRLIDALIAATALANDLPLYTQDRDFGWIPGLSVHVV